MKTTVKHFWPLCCPTAKSSAGNSAMCIVLSSSRSTERAVCTNRTAKQQAQQQERHHKRSRLHCHILTVLVKSCQPLGRQYSITVSCMLASLQNHPAPGWSTINMVQKDADYTCLEGHSVAVTAKKMKPYPRGCASSKTCVQQ